MRRFLELLVGATVLVAGSVAGAQQPASGDDWAGYQPPKAGAPAAPAAAKAPAAAPQQPAAAKPAEPRPPAPAATPLPAPTVPAAADQPAPGTSAEVRESVLPGGEAHSPATRNHALLDGKNLRVTPGLFGATGLLRIGSADLGRPGVVRLSLLGEYFSSQDFPVLGARNTRTAGTLAAGYTFHRYGEAYLSYTAAANTNSQATPPLMQSQGDIGIGVKGALEPAKGVLAGADLRFNLFPGMGAQDLRGYAFGFAPRLLGTFDVRQYAPKVPLRAHLNLGFTLDGTGDMTDRVLTPAEEYALGINKFHRFNLGLALEAPLPWATPFLEWGMGYPIKASDLIGPDGAAVGIGSAMPMQLSLGAKVTALRDVSFLAAVDLGLTRFVARGIPATQPFNLVFGVSYNFDPLTRGETRLVERTVTVEKKVEVATAPPSYTGKVAGTVLDATTKEPIPGVVVAMAGSGLPPVASDVEGGKFLTYDLPSGKSQLTFAKAGYKPAVVETAVEIGKIASVQALLVREIKYATVKVTLASGKKKVPGKVKFTGAQAAELAVDAKGGSEVSLPKGHYFAAVESEGYLSKSRELDVPETGEMHFDVDLAPQPKKTLVVIKDDRIQIKQQVHFATGKATILGDSYQLLDAVIDAVLRTNVKKLRVEGHTDNKGNKDANLKLSQARAQAVMEYLVKNGVEPSRLQSEGYGDTRPVAPNLTARGRELNRRVEFMIVEK